jgi:hypothetical protein
MPRTLNADNLGEVGETAFKLLCDQAGLVCNKSTRDRSGWDFIVEFPLSTSSPSVALDQWPVAECRVQVKSTLGGSDRISARLSSVEILSKNPGLSAMVVVLLRADGTGLAGYLIHLLGDELERVLKRLRHAQANQMLDVNRATISFPYRKVGKRFAFTAEGLRGALESALSSEGQGYVVEKRRQMEELGYEGGVLQARAGFWVDGPEHLNNVLLGLTPIRPVQFEVFDTRFGIPIPYQGALFQNIAELTLKPPKMGTCQISIRAGLERAAVFEAEVYVGPPIEQIGGSHLLIRHPDFSILLKSDRLDFKTEANFVTAPRTLARWTALVRALVLMIGGNASLSITEITPLRGLSLPVMKMSDGPYSERLPALLRFLEGWQELLNVAGLTSRSEFTLGDIFDAGSAIFAVDMLRGCSRDTYFELPGLPTDNPRETSLQALYFNSATLADAAITFSAKVIFQRTSDQEWQYRSGSVEPLDVRPAVEDLDEYGSEQADTGGFKYVIDPRNITFMARSVAVAED